MRVRILSSALADLRRGQKFYENQADGLGRNFYHTTFNDIESLERLGGIHSKRYGYHRMLVTGFPYAIYYEKREGEIIVFRVLDCREDPRKTKRALE